MTMDFSASQIYTYSETISADVSTRQIQVNCDSNVAWSCRVNGNFGLNKYQDVGPTSSKKQLQIICFDDEDKTAFGEIEFSYIDDDCLRHLTIPVFFSESEYWLSIFPTTDQFDKELSNEYKVFTVKTNIPNNQIIIDLPSQENYKAFITKDNSMYLIKLIERNTTVKLSTSTYIENDKTFGRISILEFFD